LTKSVADASQELPTGLFDVSELPEDFSVSGTKPTEGWIKLEKGKVIDYSLKFGDFVVTYDESINSPITTKNGNIETSPSNWFTYSEPDENGYVSITGFNTDEYDGSITDIIIPIEDTEGNIVTEIGQRAFLNNNIITSVIMLDNVKKINDIAFLNTSSLSSVKIGSNVSIIGFSSFNMSGLTELSIPNSVTTIDGSAFMGVHINELTIPNSVETIQGGAFANISSLEKVLIGTGLTNFSVSIFSGSSNIKSLTIALNEIPAGAFAGSRNLNNITLTNDVKVIGAAAFKNTTIKDIVIPSSIIEIGSTAFQIDTLTKIINKTDKAFDWNGIITGTSGESFKTGTVTVGDRTVQIVSE